MKKIMMIITVIILSLVVFMGCSKANEPALPSSTTHYGGAVLLNGDGEVPENLYIDSGIYKAENQGILKKTMDVYGIKFIAQEDVPDDFMLSVAKTYKEMFQVTENTDLELQEKVIENLYKHNTVLPIIINEKEATIDVFESLIANNSICDIILVTDEYQEMEVVEHLLHSITDVGLSYTFESDWGFAEDSRVSKTMNQAIESKFYDISNYNYGEKDIKNRIIVQEYAYWLISSNWNLQENFGLGEEEWKLPNISKIENELSDGYLLLTETVDKVITSPSIQTLDELNNKTTSNNIDKEQNITNENYQVFVDEGDIKTDVETINKKFKGNFTKYIQ